MSKGPTLWKLPLYVLVYVVLTIYVGWHYLLDQVRRLWRRIR